MALKGDEALTLSKGFVKKTLGGAGALKGQDGKDGADGVDGKSAYEIALDNGYEGSEAEWIESLKGADGKDGTNGKDGTDGKDGEAYDDTEIREELSKKLDSDGNVGNLSVDIYTQELEATGGDDNMKNYGRELYLPEIGLADANQIYGFKRYNDKIWIMGRSYLAYTDNIENGEKTALFTQQSLQGMTYDILDFVYYGDRYILTNGYAVYSYAEGESGLSYMNVQASIDQFIEINEELYALDRSNKRIYRYDGWSFNVMMDIASDHPEASIYGFAQDSQNFAMIGMTGNVIIFNPMDRAWQYCDEYLAEMAPFGGEYTILDIYCYNDVFHYVGKRMDDEYMYIEGTQQYDYENRCLMRENWNESVISEGSLPFSFYNGGAQIVQGNDIAVMGKIGEIYYRDMLLEYSSFNDGIGRVNSSIPGEYRYDGIYDKGTFYFATSVNNILAIDVKCDTKMLAESFGELDKTDKRINAKIEQLNERIKLLEELMNV